MSALLQVLFLLFTVKVFGEIFERIGIPAILGEILAGVTLGVLFLDIDLEVLSFFAELGAIFLLFTAGYKEVHLKDLKSASEIALVPTLFQIILAFAFGFGIGRLFSFGFLESLFMAVAFSPTSIGVVVRTLIDLDYLSTRPGTVMLSSSILDDIIGIFFLSIVVTFARFQQVPSAGQVLLIAGKILAFLGLMYLLGKYFFPRLFVYVQRMHAKEAIFAFVVMVALFSAYLAELFELHAVIGAFIGGVLISEIPLAKLQDVQSKVSGLAYGILIPFFFAFIGYSIELASLEGTGLFTLLVTVAALSGKLIGGFIGSKAVGFDFYDSLIFGIGVMPRAGVELVVLSIGRGLGIISKEVFSAIVVMVAVSIIVSPVCLKWAILKKKKKSGD
ncbi:cation:proton antiporter [Methanosarcina sp. KYL-1]|uniref:cation:proton antiporter n=1 Tax=Methanosarcina sp. KYL-1 TaxID=2602068 RepID=UPI002100769C|nr:cation:proton antiporter [Methanosarcina sp. KYL-1]